MITAQMMPRVQVRMVDAGMSKSSVLATAERTSGYGESSSIEWRQDMAWWTSYVFTSSPNSRTSFSSRFGSSNSVTAIVSFNPGREGVRHCPARRCNREPSFPVYSFSGAETELVLEFSTSPCSLVIAACTVRAIGGDTRKVGGQGSFLLRRVGP